MAGGSGSVTGLALLLGGCGPGGGDPWFRRRLLEDLVRISVKPSDVVWGRVGELVGREVLAGAGIRGGSGVGFRVWVTWLGGGAGCS